MKSIVKICNDKVGVEENTFSISNDSLAFRKYKIEILLDGQKMSFYLNYNELSEMIRAINSVSLNLTEE